MEAMSQHRVILIDDDEDVRTLIEALLSLDDRFRLVGTAGNGAEGISLAARLQPDVIVLDLEMPVMDGLEAIAPLRQRVPDARIIVFSAFPDSYTLVDVVMRGADAYLDKAGAWLELLPTMAAACGENSEEFDVSTDVRLG